MELDNKTETPIELTQTQKLHALAYKYYQHSKWHPKTGDYYTTSRADLELYQIVDATHEYVRTRYCDPSKGDSISQWDADKFLKDFGENRVYVPDFIIKMKLSDSKSLINGKEGWISVDDKPLITKNDKGNWECTQDGEGELIAALPYTDLNIPGKTFWWIRLCVIEDEIGLCVIGDDENDPAGWQIEDVTHYIKLPEPPSKPKQ